MALKDYASDSGWDDIPISSLERGFLLSVYHQIAEKKAQVIEPFRKKDGFLNSEYVDNVSDGWDFLCELEEIVVRRLRGDSVED